MATPRAASATANATMPLLSLTEISARRIGRRPGVITADIGVSGEPRQASRAAGQSRQQDHDGGGGHGEGGGTPPVLRRPAAADQHQIGGDYPPDHGRMAEAATHSLLIEMLAVRLPHALATQEAAAEGNRRIGKKVERQG